MKDKEQSVNLKDLNFDEYEKGAEVVCRNPDIKIIKVIKIGIPEYEKKYIVFAQRKFGDIFTYQVYDNGAVHSLGFPHANDVLIKAKTTTKYFNIYKVGGMYICGPFSHDEISAVTTRRYDLDYVGSGSVNMAELKLR